MFIAVRGVWLSLKGKRAERIVLDWEDECGVELLIPY